MLVILKKNVKGTGKAGDIVKVSDGFANNRLIPAGLAVPATNQNVKSAEKQKAFIEKKNAEEKAAAEATAKKLESKTVTIKTRVGITESCSDPSLPWISPTQSRSRLETRLTRKKSFFPSRLRKLVSTP